MTPQKRVSMWRAQLERQYAERDRLARQLREMDEAIAESCGEFLRAVEALRAAPPDTKADAEKGD